MEKAFKFIFDSKGEVISVAKSPDNGKTWLLASADSSWTNHDIKSMPIPIVYLPGDCIIINGNRYCW